MTSVSRILEKRLDLKKQRKMKKGEKIKLRTFFTMAKDFNIQTYGIKKLLENRLKSKSDLFWLIIKVGRKVFEIYFREKPAYQGFPLYCRS